MVKPKDNGGRRSGIDRREFTFSKHIPERRTQTQRRKIPDRRASTTIPFEEEIERRSPAA